MDSSVGDMKQYFIKAVADIDSKLTHWQDTLRQYEGLQAKLKELPVKLSHEVMVPMGNAAFMPGQLYRTNQVMVLLGDDWFVEVSVTHGLAILERRMMKINGTLAALELEKKETQSRLDWVGQMIEGVSAGEIREAFVEEEETEWKSIHRRRTLAERQRERLWQASLPEPGFMTKNDPVNPGEDESNEPVASSSTDCKPAKHISPKKIATGAAASKSGSTEGRSEKKVSDEDYNETMRRLDELELEESRDQQPLSNEPMIGQLMPDRSLTCDKGNGKVVAIDNSNIKSSTKSVSDGNRSCGVARRGFTKDILFNDDDNNEKYDSDIPTGKPTEISQEQYDKLLAQLDAMEVMEDDDSDDDEEEDGDSTENSHSDPENEPVVDNFSSQSVEISSQNENSVLKKKGVRWDLKSYTPGQDVRDKSRDVNPFSVLDQLDNAELLDENAYLDRLKGGKPTTSRGENEENMGNTEASSTRKKKPSKEPRFDVELASESSGNPQKIINADTEFSCMPKSILKNAETFMTKHYAENTPIVSEIVPEVQPRPKIIHPDSVCFDIKERQVDPSEVLKLSVLTDQDAKSSESVEPGEKKASKKPISKFKQRALNRKIN